tara:strand:- start:52786 stop:53043 length:258 start_codon:yes stop_codon:yes gene_type:complete
MNTKLTLTIEQTVIEKAKLYAKSKGRSLSDLVENYLQLMVEDKEVRSLNSAPIASSLRGTFKAPASFSYKEELAKALSQKHLLDE